MDPLTFLASLIQSLAWPGLVLLLAIVFRAPLVRILFTLNSLRYKEFSADFGRKLSELEATVEQAQLPPPSEAADAEEPPGRRAPRELPEQIEAVAQVSPLAAIPLAWIQVENRLNSLARRLRLPGARVGSARSTIVALHESGLISEEESTALDQLRSMRNLIVHARVLDTSISLDQALEYAELARRIDSRLERIERGD